MPIAKRCSCLLFLGCLLILPSVAVFAQASNTMKAQPNDATCIDCIRIRVGLPRIVRGPDGTAVDNTFNEIKLPNGRFRGLLPLRRAHRRRKPGVEPDVVHYLQ